MSYILSDRHADRPQTRAHLPPVGRPRRTPSHRSRLLALDLTPSVYAFRCSVPPVVCFVDGVSNPCRMRSLCSTLLRSSLYPHVSAPVPSIC